MAPFGGRDGRRGRGGLREPTSRFWAGGYLAALRDGPILSASRLVPRTYFGYAASRSVARYGIKARMAKARSRRTSRRLLSPALLANL